MAPTLAFAQAGAVMRATRDSSRVSTRPLGSCEVNKIAYRTENTFIATNSINFVNVPLSSHTFVQGAGGGCIVVRFSAETRAQPGTIVGMMALLDATTQGLPGYVLWASDYPDFENPCTCSGGSDSPIGFNVRNFEFIFPDVPAGVHTVRMQWARLGGSPAELFFRTLTISHR